MITLHHNQTIIYIMANKKRDLKPDIDKKSLGVNPFINDVVFYYKEWEDKKKYTLVEEDMVNVVIRKEYADYTKVYRNSDMRKITMNFSDKSCKLYLWLIYEAEDGVDYIWINKNRCLDELGIKSETTYGNCIKELIRYGAIQLTIYQNVFWINPIFFFAGDKLKKYPNNIQKIN